MEGFTDKLRGKLRVQALNIIGRKNPFLFRVRSGDDLDELTRMVVDAYLSSSEETMFGIILEDIAISVCSKAKGGGKSSAEGIDLEYDENGERTLIQVKSGPNWGNSSQRTKLVDNFNSARKRLGPSKMSVRCVEGICYGCRPMKDYGTHIALVGEAFWKDISGWDSAHFAIGNVLGEHAGNGLSETKMAARRNIAEFLEQHGAAQEGKVDWQGMFDLLF